MLFLLVPLRSRPRTSAEQIYQMKLLNAIGPDTDSGAHCECPPSCEAGPTHRSRQTPNGASDEERSPKNAILRVLDSTLRCRQKSFQQKIGARKAIGHVRPCL